jgi:hypothetical protein
MKLYPNTLLKPIDFETKAAKNSKSTLFPQPADSVAEF